jgi:hypothetical protein
MVLPANSGLPRFVERELEFFEMHLGPLMSLGPPRRGTVRTMVSAEVDRWIPVAPRR